MKLLGKHKDEEEWEVMQITTFDETTEDDEYRQKEILSDYRKTFGKNWQFKWEEE